MQGDPSAFEMDRHSSTWLKHTQVKWVLGSEVGGRGAVVYVKSFIAHTVIVVHTAQTIIMCVCIHNTHIRTYAMLCYCV